MNEGQDEGRDATFSIPFHDVLKLLQLDKMYMRHNTETHKNCHFNKDDHFGNQKRKAVI